MIRREVDASHQPGGRFVCHIEPGGRRARGTFRLAHVPGLTSQIKICRVEMDCRIGCGACCIALSISSKIPGMPNGKKAGVRCINLSADNICVIHNSVDYPKVCRSLRPSEEMCGACFTEALVYLENLEALTAPE